MFIFVKFLQLKVIALQHTLKEIFFCEISCETRLNQSNTEVFLSIQLYSYLIRLALLGLGLG